MMRISNVAVGRFALALAGLMAWPCLLAQGPEAAGATVTREEVGNRCELAANSFSQAREPTIGGAGLGHRP